LDGKNQVFTESKSQVSFEDTRQNKKGIPQ